MKTPYDSALRLRQREIGEMRVLINAEVSQIAALDAQRAAIEDGARAEAEIASTQYAFPAHAFASRMRAQRDALCGERVASDERLMLLRAKALEAFGSLSAIEAASDRHRAEALRLGAIAEQSQLDDFSAARFTRALHAARRLREAPTAAS